MAAKPKNTICLMVKQYIEKFMNEQLIKGIEQKWDYVGNFLSYLINNGNFLGYFFMYPASYFYPFKTYIEMDNFIFDKIINIPKDIIKEIENSCFGQSFSNSVRSLEFKSKGEEELLNSEYAYSKLFRFALNKTEIKNHEDIDSIIYNSLTELYWRAKESEKLENRFNNLIDAIAWFIPLKKWRNKFRNKIYKTL